MDSVRETPYGQDKAQEALDDVAASTVVYARSPAGRDVPTTCCRMPYNLAYFQDGSIDAKILC